MNKSIHRVPVQMMRLPDTSGGKEGVKFDKYEYPNGGDKHSDKVNGGSAEVHQHGRPLQVERGSVVAAQHSKGRTHL